MDKIKQYIAFFGGLLAAIYYFLQTIQVEISWFHMDSINAFLGILVAAVPFMLLVYGLYKNTYIFTPKARNQEDYLKKRGLK